LEIPETLPKSVELNPKKKYPQTRFGTRNETTSFGDPTAAET